MRYAGRLLESAALLDVVQEGQAASPVAAGVADAASGAKALNVLDGELKAWALRAHILLDVLLKFWSLCCWPVDEHTRLADEVAFASAWF